MGMHIHVHTHAYIPPPPTYAHIHAQSCMHTHNYIYMYITENLSFQHIAAMVDIHPKVPPSSERLKMPDLFEFLVSGK